LKKVTRDTGTECVNWHGYCEFLLAGSQHQFVSRERNTVLLKLLLFRLLRRGQTDCQCWARGRYFHETVRMKRNSFG